jgi:hypothetical protein
MRKLFAVSMILIALCAIPAMAATTTLTGVITDDMCGSEHMMPGKSNAECARACVKHGSKYVLMSGGKNYALAGKASEVDALAGKKVTVSGDLSGVTLTVSSIAAAN